MFGRRALQVVFLNLKLINPYLFIIIIIIIELDL